MTKLTVGVILVMLVYLASEAECDVQTYENTFEWHVRDYPNPFSNDTDQQQRCNRDRISSVCDPNRIVTNEQASQIDRAIDDVYQNTTCRCYECKQKNKGYIIRVAILPKMKRIFPDSGNSSYARLRDARMYAYILSTQWKMHGLCDESLLILYAKYDDILFTLTRQGTSGSLRNEDIKRISIGVRSYFDTNETIAQGILEMIRQYKAILMRAS